MVLHIFRLERGEDILRGCLNQLQLKGLQSGWIVGLGAVSRLRIAWWNPATLSYEEREWAEQAEVCCLTGNVATDEEGSLILHLHVVAALSDGRCVGGHVLEGCIVNPTLEVAVLPVAPLLRRVLDPTTRLRLLAP